MEAGTVRPHASVRTGLQKLLLKQQSILWFD